jgi:hypothetical protein
MHHNHVASELVLTDRGNGGRLDPASVQLTSSGVSGLRTLRDRFASASVAAASRPARRAKTKKPVSNER